MVNDMVTKRAAIDMTWRMVCRRLKEKLPEAAFRNWTDKYVLLEISDDKAIIGYRPEASQELFEKEAGDGHESADGEHVRIVLPQIGKKL